jgi:TPP-dependent 2-oxoacid decarboxylase
MRVPMSPSASPDPYNDIANWAYADLPKVFRPDTSARSFVVRTNGDLQNALSAPNDAMIFVESIMDPCDALAAVTSSSNNGPNSTTGRAARNTATTCSSGRPPTTVDPP